MKNLIWGQPLRSSPANIRRDAPISWMLRKPKARQVRRTAGLLTVSGALLVLALAEVCLQPWADRLHRFDAAPLGMDRLDAPVREIHYFDEGIATARFTPSRARLTSHRPLPGAPYIVALGDSLVEALQVNDDETFGSLVESKSISDGMRVNVRQYGWSGASTVKYALEADQVERLWKPRMVVVVAIREDFLPFSLNSYWSRATIRDGRVVASLTGRDSTSLRASWRWTFKSALLSLVIGRARDIQTLIGAFSTGPAADASQQNVEEPELSRALIAELQEAYGDRLFLIYTARPTLSDFGPEQSENIVLRQCALMRVRCVSTGPWIRGARDSGEFLGNGFLNSRPGSGHYNAAGHRILAELVWREYRARELDGKF